MNNQPTNKENKKTSSKDRTTDWSYYVVPTILDTPEDELTILDACGYRKPVYGVTYR